MWPHGCKRCGKRVFGPSLCFDSDALRKRLIFLVTASTFKGCSREHQQAISVQAFNTVNFGKVRHTDPEKMQEAPKASYLNLQKAIAALPDNDSQASVKLFGRDMTKQGPLMLILLDQHEHLGQSIAYARTTAWFRPDLTRSAAGVIWLPPMR